MHQMRSTVGPLLAAFALLGASCGILPKYEDVRKGETAGRYTLKIRGAVWENFDMTREERPPGPVDDQFDSDRSSGFGIEVERWLVGGWTANVVLETRTYQFDGLPEAESDQIHAGVRHYFGERVLRAFVAGQLVFGFGMEFANKTETETWLGYAVGGGLDLTLSKHFSVETYLMYEGMPDVKGYLYGDRDTPDGYQYGVNGPVVYFALGWHF